MASRETAVAGSFYPKEKKELLIQLKAFFKGIKPVGKSKCIIAPHAGYMYSGNIAAHSYNALEKSDTFVILSPNHTGIGADVSISDANFWETPLGKIEVDSGFRQKLLEKLGIESEDLAHIGEHSIEVQLPFIQFLFPKAKIVPITIMEHSLKALEELGKAIFETGNGKIGVVASSDFTHGLPEKEAREKDLEAVKLIEKMDISGFHSKILGERLTICGFAPIVAAMTFARESGLKSGKLLNYDNSASVTKDLNSVVGYAAIKFD